MQTVFEIVLPLFALVLCGYLLGRGRWMGEAGIAGISSFVFYLAVPALLFRAMARGPEAFDLDIVLAYFSGLPVVFLAAVALSRLLFRRPAEEQVLMGMGAIFSNTVLLGIPLVFTAFGEAGGLKLMSVIAFHAVIILPAMTFLVELARGSRGGWRGSTLASLRALGGNPIILALVLGIAYGATGWPLPRALDRFTELLGGAAAPCALFALGASLTGFRLGGDLKEVAAVTSLKLVLHPLVGAVLAYWVFDLPPLSAAVAVVTAALPSGANVFILARHYNVYLARSASAVLISTAVSVVTLTILIAHLRAPG